MRKKRAGGGREGDRGGKRRQQWGWGGRWEKKEFGILRVAAKVLAEGARREREHAEEVEARD